MRISVFFLFLFALAACDHNGEHGHDHDHDGEHAHDHDEGHGHDHDGHHDKDSEYYEYRIYKLSSAEQQEGVSSFLSDALIPAYHRHGIETVGAFSIIDPEIGFDVHTLIQLDDFEEYENLYAGIYHDPTFLKDGASFLHQDDPEYTPYDRINSKLMVAFDSMPQLALPRAGSTERVFEIRSYESATEDKGSWKVAMFNEGGEVPIFNDLGFQPVFFAEAITGDEMPNLVYMVTYESADVRDAFWKSFGADPRWVAIKDLPQYKGTVSKIHSHMVKAIPGSDIR